MSCIPIEKADTYNLLQKYLISATAWDVISINN